MSILNGECIISSDKGLMQLDRIKAMLSNTYWAANRPDGDIKRTIENSVCFGGFVNGVQVAFARVVTDYVTVFYICDVVVGEAYRGNGIGKKLINAITGDERFNQLLGILITSDAHGLYEQYGFKHDDGKLMYRPKG